MKLTIKILLAAFFTMLLSANAQEKLQMMNGGLYDVKVLDTTSNKISVEYLKKNKPKILVLNKEDVFSLKYANGKEIIFYKQDSLSEENYMVPSEMEAYIAGQRDAIKGFHSPVTTIGSFVVGAAAPFALAPIVGGYAYFLSPLPIGAYIGIAGARWIKIKRKNVSDPKYLKSDTYIMGYDHAARGKRVQNSMIGGGLGLLVGIISSVILVSLK